MRMEFDEIRAWLPQKFPFLMLDRVLELDVDQRIVAIKNITGNEIVFLGHFPNTAVFPGALVIESMAQAAIILFRKRADSGPADDEQRLFLFGAVKARFMRPVVPGDQLRIELSITKGVSAGAIVSGVATVEGDLVAKAELSFGVKNATGHEQSEPTSPAVNGNASSR
jgi:3-hydroxyacyl-[acyl-carrier-protein] dehydratase